MANIGAARDVNPINMEWPVEFRFGAQSGLKSDMSAR
jgi:hypothetical protein